VDVKGWIRVVVPGEADVDSMTTVFQVAEDLQDRDYEIWLTAPHPQGGTGEVLRAWRHGDKQGKGN
jgi:hypothetical protein